MYVIPSRVPTWFKTPPLYWLQCPSTPQCKAEPCASHTDPLPLNNPRCAHRPPRADSRRVWRQTSPGDTAIASPPPPSAPTGSCFAPCPSIWSVAVTPGTSWRKIKTSIKEAQNMRLLGLLIPRGPRTLWDVLRYIIEILHRRMSNQRDSKTWESVQI